MSGALSKIRETLIYSTVVYDGKGHVRKQVDEDNRKTAVIWSVVEIAFWILCLLISINDEDFQRCRALYITALVLSTVTLVLSASVARKSPKLTPIIVVAMQIFLIGAGIGLSFFQWDIRSATFVAAVLIVPVMFVCDTIQPLVCVVLGIVAFAILGPYVIAPDVFSWTFKTLLIFSVAGVLIGHIINKSRFERYSYAESALELAELRDKFAHYDQLTELRNRRAYSEKVEQLELDMPSACCVVMADINGLKQANDTYGHHAGDELIIGAAECLKRSFEGIGKVFRLGGDEFCVIAEGTEEDVAERLLIMEQMAASWKGEHINGISISYGVATAQDNPDVDSVLKAADRAMYEFKRDYYTTSGRERRHQ